MKNKSCYRIIVALSILLTGCSRALQGDNAKKNADYIMEHIDDKNIIDYFPKKYFSRDPNILLLEELNMRCLKSSRTGGYKDTKWIVNFTGNDMIAFIYYEDV